MKLNNVNNINNTRMLQRKCSIYSKTSRGNPLNLSPVTKEETLKMLREKTCSNDGNKIPRKQEKEETLKPVIDEQVYHLVNPRQNRKYRRNKAKSNLENDSNDTLQPIIATRKLKTTKNPKGLLKKSIITQELKRTNDTKVVFKSPISTGNNPVKVDVSCEQVLDIDFPSDTSRPSCSECHVEDLVSTSQTTESEDRYVSRDVVKVITAPLKYAGSGFSIMGNMMNNDETSATENIPQKSSKILKSKYIPPNDSRTCCSEFNRFSTSHTENSEDRYIICDALKVVTSPLKYTGLGFGGKGNIINKDETSGTENIIKNSQQSPKYLKSKKDLPSKLPRASFSEFNFEDQRSNSQTTKSEDRYIVRDALKVVTSPLKHVGAGVVEIGNSYYRSFRKQHRVQNRKFNHRTLHNDIHGKCNKLKRKNSMIQERTIQDKLQILHNLKKPNVQATTLLIPKGNFHPSSVNDKQNQTVAKESKSLFSLNTFINDSLSNLENNSKIESEEIIAEEESTVLSSLKTFIVDGYDYHLNVENNTKREREEIMTEDDSTALSSLKTFMIDDYHQSHHDVEKLVTKDKEEITAREETISNEVISKKDTVSKEVIAQEATVSEVISKRDTVSEVIAKEEIISNEEVISKRDTVLEVIAKEDNVSKEVIAVRDTIINEVISKHKLLDKQELPAKEYITSKDKFATKKEGIVKKGMLAKEEVISKKGFTVNEEIITKIESITEHGIIAKREITAKEGNISKADTVVFSSPLKPLIYPSPLKPLIYPGQTSGDWNSEIERKVDQSTQTREITESDLLSQISQTNEIHQHFHSKCLSQTDKPLNKHNTMKNDTVTNIIKSFEAMSSKNKPSFDCLPSKLNSTVSNDKIPEDNFKSLSDTSTKPAVNGFTITFSIRSKRNTKTQGKRTISNNSVKLNNDKISSKAVSKDLQPGRDSAEHRLVDSDKYGGYKTIREQSHLNKKDQIIHPHNQTSDTKRTTPNYEDLGDRTNYSLERKHVKILGETQIQTCVLPSENIDLQPTNSDYSNIKETREQKCRSLAMEVNPRTFTSGQSTQLCVSSVPRTHSSMSYVNLPGYVNQFKNDELGSKSHPNAKYQTDASFSRQIKTESKGKPNGLSEYECHSATKTDRLTKTGICPRILPLPHNGGSNRSPVNSKHECRDASPVIKENKSIFTSLISESDISSSISDISQSLGTLESFCEMKNLKESSNSVYQNNKTGSCGTVVRGSNDATSARCVTMCDLKTTSIGDYLARKNQRVSSANSGFNVSGSKTGRSVRSYPGNFSPGDQLRRLVGYQSKPVNRSSYHRKPGHEFGYHSKLWNPVHQSGYHSKQNHPSINHQPFPTVNKKIHDDEIESRREDQSDKVQHDQRKTRGNRSLEQTKFPTNYIRNRQVHRASEMKPYCSAYEAPSSYIRDVEPVTLKYPDFQPNQSKFSQTASSWKKRLECDKITNKSISHRFQTVPCGSCPYKTTKTIHKKRAAEDEPFIVNGRHVNKIEDNTPQQRNRSDIQETYQPNYFEIERKKLQILSLNNETNMIKPRSRAPTSLRVLKNTKSLGSRSKQFCRKLLKKIKFKLQVG